MGTEKLILPMLEDTFDRDSYRPIRVFLSNEVEKKTFFSKHLGLQIVDQFKNLLEELFLLRNPRLRFGRDRRSDFQSFLEKYTKKLPLEKKGQWLYFPWSKLLVRYLPEKEHLELRTGRNKNLINGEEQNKYYNSCVAILGMSVGSHVALTIAMTGGSRYLKLADPDTVSGSNLNRIRSGFSQVGLSKVTSVARQIYEINPYAKITLFRQGVNQRNLQRIFEEGRRPDLLIEEMDNPYYKIKVRELARRFGIPVIMAADNGDGVIVDVERFDINKKIPILHNIIPNITSDMFKHVASSDLPKIIARMAGAEYASQRMLDSVAQVGDKLYSWPQLGTAATLCGSVLAHVGRRVILKENITTGRYIVDEKRMFNKVI